MDESDKPEKIKGRKSDEKSHRKMCIAAQFSMHV